MNVLLADVQSLQVNMPHSAVVADSDSSTVAEYETHDFTHVFQYHISENAENNSQGIEIKGVFTDKDIADAGTLIPQIWLDEFAMDDAGFTTGSEPVLESIDDPSSPISNSQNNAAVHADLPYPVITGPVASIGEVLPVGGGKLPAAIEVSSALKPVKWLDSDVKRGIQRNSSNVLVASTQENEVVQQDKFPATKNEFSLLANIEENSLPEFEPMTQTEKLAESLVAKLHRVQNNSDPIPDAGISRHTPNVSALSSGSNLAANLSTPLELEPLPIVRPENASDWGKGLGDRVSWMINQKLNTASMRLDPAMLGKLEINIQVGDDITNITINVQQSQTREMIENASFRLRDQLQEAGFQNVNVDVSHDDGQNQPGAQHLADSSGGTASATETMQPAASDDTLQAAVDYYSDSLVDYFV